MPAALNTFAPSIRLSSTRPGTGLAGHGRVRYPGDGPRTGPGEVIGGRRVMPARASCRWPVPGASRSRSSGWRRYRLPGEPAAETATGSWPPGQAHSHLISRNSREETLLIVLRGNSGSGKSSVAAEIRARYGRGIAIVGLSDRTRNRICFELQKYVVDMFMTCCQMVVTSSQPGSLMR